MLTAVVNKKEGFYFSKINLCKLEVKNAILCLNMKNFGLLESVSKEIIKKTTNRQMTGL